jgi:cytochrome c oxidase cbb3-type subunit 3
VHGDSVDDVKIADDATLSGIAARGAVKAWEERRMLDRSRLPLSSRIEARRVIATALLAISVCLCGAAISPATAEPVNLEEDYGEFTARPEELASVAINDIVKSLRLNKTAMVIGQAVYNKSCASCHGADLKGVADQHTPDLTDAEWRFSGDDYQSGGVTKFPSDVEWTVRYGIRSGHPNARGAEVNMLAYDPKFRNEEDTKDFGDQEFLNSSEIDDVVEYVLRLSGQRFDRAKAARGRALFNNNAKGNCVDCHGADGSGIDTFGSSNLTKKNLYLYGSDRASIRESLVKGRHGKMPAFEDVLKPEEIKAVSVFVFSHAATPPRSAPARREPAGRTRR